MAPEQCQYGAIGSGQPPRGLQQQLPANEEALGLMQLPALRGESLWTRLGLWPQLLLWLGFLSRTCFSTDERQSP